MTHPGLYFFAAALTVLSAAVFTPQAAATAAFMSTPARRGRAITFVFISH